MQLHKARHFKFKSLIINANKILLLINRINLFLIAANLHLIFASPR